MTSVENKPTNTAAAPTTTKSKDKKTKEPVEPFFVYYKEEKYNIGNFIKRHPGGSDVFATYKDKDITQIFHHIGHSEDALFMLKKRLVKEESEDSKKTDEELQAEIEQQEKEDRLTFSTTKLSKKFVMKKLFTEEDKNYIHKILGFSALISYVYRYCYVLPTTGTLGFGNDWFSYFTLFLHMLLSCSSLIFHVLNQRIITNPLIIYEEYRLHAIVFSFRAFIVSILGLNMHLIDNLGTKMIILDVTMLLIHFVVDYITYKYAKPGVSAVRVRSDKPGRLKYLKMTYSFYQFIALGSHLLVDDNLKDLGFNALIAIQSSAFLMTLKRKNIIEWWSHAFWYSLALAFSTYVIWTYKGTEFMYYVLIVFLLRISFNISKYPLWFMYVCMYWNVIINSNFEFVSRLKEFDFYNMNFM